MNILHLASWYPNRIHPRDGNFVEKHVRSVAPYAEMVVLHAQEDNDLAPGALELVWSEAAGEAAPVMRVYYGVDGIVPVLSRLLQRFRAYRRGYRELSRRFGPFDLVHVHVLLYAGIFAWYLRLRYRIPYLITEHSTLFQSPLPWYLRLLARLVAGRAELLLPVSQQLAGRLTGEGIHCRCEIIPNVVDADLFNLVPRQGDGACRFLHISNFNDVHKNVEGMMRVIRQLSRHRPDCHFTFAGDGDVGEVVAMARRLKVPAANITVKGDMTEAEVAREMQAHDVFVLFSNYENLPVVLLEAQCCGMPVIATRVGGVEEIVDHPSLGTLIDPRKEGQLYEAMEQMADHFREYDRWGIAARGRARYDEEAVGLRLAGLYRQVVKEK